MTIEELKPIIEALVFVSEEPIPVKQIASLLDGETLDDIKAACEELTQEFNTRNGGMEIRLLGGGLPHFTKRELKQQATRFFEAGPAARFFLAPLGTLGVPALKTPP